MRRAVVLPSVERGAAGAVLAQEEIAAPAALEVFMNLYGKQKRYREKRGSVQATSPFIFSLYHFNYVALNIIEKTQLIEL